MVLLRYLLIVIIGFLIARAFVKSSHNNGSSGNENADRDRENGAGRKVSRDVGEYVDYEEVKKKEE